MFRSIKPEIGITRLLLLLSLLFTVGYNLAFFRNVVQVYHDSLADYLFILSLCVFLFGVTLLLLSLLCIRLLAKPLLISLAILSAGASYYMNSYNIVIDTGMIDNILQTDGREVLDLLTPSFAIQFFLLGLIPAWLLWRTRIHCRSFPRELLQRAKLVLLSVLMIVLSVVPFVPRYAGFFREHKILRYYANPATFVYSSFAYLRVELGRADTGIKTLLGTDAHIPVSDTSRELIVLVVGETARADRFGLNGYARDTTPLLEREDVISLPDVTSCGTATAYSVPCMFALSGRKDFDPDTAADSENLLDLLTHAGVQVLWRDNNSSSKGVAEHLEYQDFRGPGTNPLCDIECRDPGMLAGLDDYIAARPDGDIVIVLHQMGNHGPAYYKRYPAEFERFSPACRSSRLENCSAEEIDNAYDNAISYTDYFLSRVIDFLKSYDSRFETAMLYMSDHGESLGENGLYLHGLPWLLAPEEQKQVAALLWLGSGFRADRAWIRARARKPVSHDNFFHTVLGLMEIDTALYDNRLDLVRRDSVDECQRKECLVAAAEKQSPPR